MPFTAEAAGTYFAVQRSRAAHVACGSFASFLGHPAHVRFTLDSNRMADILDRQLRATSGLMHRSKRHTYSITSSAVNRSFGGMSRPSALAVFKLITSSYLVGC